MRGELDAYGQGLEDKVEIVALSKADAVTPEMLKDQKARLKRAAKREPLILSAASGQGVDTVLRAVRMIIDEARLSGPDADREDQEAWHP